MSRLFVSLLFILSWALFLPQISLSSDNISRAELKKIILDTLRENPQVLLDILRNNSETILEIAQHGSQVKKINSLRQQWKSDLETNKKIHLKNRPIFGDKNAKLTLVAFSDFSCHYCQASKSIVDQLLNEFKGKVNFIFKSIPLDNKGASALAGMWFYAIANQDEAKAWKFYNIMFEQRDNLAAEGEVFLRKTAEKLMLDVSKIEKDVKTDKKIKELLKEDQDDAEVINLEGTPCFYINNIIVRGSIPLDYFRIAIKMALKEAH